MSKVCFKAVILSISMALLVVSCSEKTIVEDKPDIWTFSVDNLLDEEVSISGSANGKQFSITLSPNESYSYTQDTMSGSIEKGKIPVYLSSAIKIDGAKSGFIEYQTEEFQRKWVEKTDHCLVFKITGSLFLAE